MGHRNSIFHVSPSAPEEKLEMREGMAQASTAHDPSAVAACCAYGSDRRAPSDGVARNGG